MAMARATAKASAVVRVRRVSGADRRPSCLREGGRGRARTGIHGVRTMECSTTTRGSILVVPCARRHVGATSSLRRRVIFRRRGLRYDARGLHVATWFQLLSKVSGDVWFCRSEADDLVHFWGGTQPVVRTTCGHRTSTAPLQLRADAWPVLESLGARSRDDSVGRP